MRRELLPDALWERVQPLLPPHRSRPKGGRPPANDRNCLRGILFVLKTGIQWEDLPHEVFGACGMTCWRRMRDWQTAGVWSALQRLLLDELGEAGRINWKRAAVDSSSVRAPKKGKLTGPNPTDRAKAGSKHHILVDVEGSPLAESLTAANTHDTHELFPLLDAVPAVQGPRGRPRFRPEKLHADKAYASKKNRRGLRKRGIKPRIARPGIESKERLGRHRWVVERSLAWLHQLRRLSTRYERRDDTHFAFLALGCCVLLFRKLFPALS
ncbi:MAG: IS5 family transposase [Alphaproteobacteria bacterium]|nr:MAG: IS5 family transposase [Alphaproteobacteria bacterium]